MRAAVLTEYKKPWKIEERPDPKPAAGQVVIRVEASGLCGTDVHIHNGEMPFIAAPIVCGHEPVGKIAEVGEGVTSLRVGDRVGVSWFQKGCGRCAACQGDRSRYCRESQSWMQLGGGNSELMLAWADGCTLVPEGTSPEAAAPIFCAGYTVFSGLRMADPKPGERAAIIGIGGLGHLGVQFAKALGLETVAVTGREAKKKDALEMGADDVVISGGDLGQSLMATGGADIIVTTTSSSKQVAQALDGLRPEGRLVTLGALDAPIQVDAMTLMFPPRRLVGGTQGDRKDLVDALSLVARGRVKPQVETYPLDQVNDVLQRQADGKVRYRAVLQHG